MLVLIVNDLVLEGSQDAIVTSPAVRNVYDWQDLCNRIFFEANQIISHIIHVRYIYLHLVDIFE